jgi:hypothetical protein
MARTDLREPIVANLAERGYQVFEKCLPEAMCDRLIRFALTQPCRTRAMDQCLSASEHAGAYPRGAPGAVRYDFSTEDLLANPDVQALLADLSLVALAQGYLRARPIVDVVQMWWHTDYSKTPDSLAAQYFHFDMDRPKWIKFFIYLTDVTPANGPHLFVAGSHRTNVIPPMLLRKGYSRLTDDEVHQVFGKKDIIEFSAPRGTIIAEDTRGLHKGRHVFGGDRLMLQIQFSNSLFGATYPGAKLPDILSPELRARMGQYPDLYSAYRTKHGILSWK